MMIKPNTIIEDLDIVLVGENILCDVERFVFACEHCAEYAPMALDYLLDALTGCDPTITTYLMRRPAHCPSCSARLTEKTLVAV
jgi:hypothetical protein